jgi:hypothetical protein
MLFLYTKHQRANGRYSTPDKAFKSTDITYYPVKSGTYFDDKNNIHYYYDAFMRRIYYSGYYYDKYGRLFYFNANTLTHTYFNRGTTEQEAEIVEAYNLSNYDIEIQDKEKVSVILILRKSVYNGSISFKGN